MHLVHPSGTPHSATEVWACNAWVILTNAVFEEATARHVTVEPAMVHFTPNPLLVFNVFNYALLCEFVCLRNWQALG